MKNHYIQAVLELLESGTDISVVLEGLRATLAKKDHEALYGAILRGIYRFLESKRVQGGVVVTVAHEAAITKHQTAIADALRALKVAENEYETNIDETLIGGAVVMNNNMQIDMSYKTKLIQLYRTITK